ncbi:MAG: hypothetical protein ABJD07_08245 [Gemmatimonadaceae bacterium]
MAHALAIPAIVLAQAPAAKPVCTIEYDKLPKPATLAYVTVLEGKATGDAQKKLLRDGQASIQGGKVDPLASAYYTARELIWYAELPAAPATMKRSDLGYATNPDAMVELYPAIDSSLKVVEIAQPACFELVTKNYRSYLWGKSINLAVPYLNATPAGADSAAFRVKIDSAIRLLDRANKINPGKPQGYFYYSYAKQKLGDWAGSADALKTTLQYASPDAVSKDTVLRPVRHDALLNLGVAYQSMIDMIADPAAKKAAAAPGIAAFRAFLAEYPTGEQSEAVQRALTRMLTISGDSTAIAAAKLDMLKNPKKYTEAMIVNTGVEAYNEKTDKSRELAVQYFIAALTVNTNSREALLYLLNAQSTLKRYDEAIVTGGKLLAIDPNSSFAYHQIAYAYQELAKTTAAAPMKKSRSDSAVAYTAKETKLPVVVAINSSTRENNVITVKGVIENKQKTAKKVTLRFDFLDADGGVVGTSESQCLTAAAPGACTINPNGKEPFTVSFNKPNATSYRYAAQVQ